MTKKADAKSKGIKMPIIDWRSIIVDVEGLPPGLILDRNPMLDDEPTGKPEPEVAVDRALHKLAEPTNGQLYGIPASSFQQAFIDASRFSKLKKMTEMRGIITVVGGADGLVPIDGTDYKTLTRPVTTRGRGGITCTVKHSPIFPKWSASVQIDYIEGQITQEQLLGQVKWAGYSVGVGAWAPRHKCSGPHGRFEIVGVRMNL